MDEPFDDRILLEMVQKNVTTIRAQGEKTRQTFEAQKKSLTNKNLVIKAVATQAKLVESFLKLCSPIWDGPLPDLEKWWDIVEKENLLAQYDIVANTYFASGSTDRFIYAIIRNSFLYAKDEKLEGDALEKRAFQISNRILYFYHLMVLCYNEIEERIKRFPYGKKFYNLLATDSPSFLREVLDQSRAQIRGWLSKLPGWPPKSDEELLEALSTEVKTRHIGKKVKTLRDFLTLEDIRNHFVKDLYEGYTELARESATSAEFPESVPYAGLKPNPFWDTLTPIVMSFWLSKEVGILLPFLEGKTELVPLKARDKDHDRSRRGRMKDPNNPESFIEPEKLEFETKEEEIGKRASPNMLGLWTIKAMNALRPDPYGFYKDLLSAIEKHAIQRADLELEKRKLAVQLSKLRGPKKKKLAKAFELLGKGSTREEAARKAGISLPTLRKVTKKTKTIKKL